MSTTETKNNSLSNNKLKRKRIFTEMMIKGEIVAKSYVDFDLRKAITAQVITYSNISYSIVKREIILR